jgi:ABC-type phosphate/phosphonate transport system substrate-binding protein
MSRWLAIPAAALALACIEPGLGSRAAQRAGQPQPLRPGLMPSIPSARPAEQYPPLVRYLEAELGQPVEPQSAPSFVALTE